MAVALHLQHHTFIYYSANNFLRFKSSTVHDALMLEFYCDVTLRDTALCGAARAARRCACALYCAAWRSAARCGMAQCCAALLCTTLCVSLEAATHTQHFIAALHNSVVALFAESAFTLLCFFARK